MEDLLKQVITQVIKPYAVDKVEVELSYPEIGYGDFATNIALKLAKPNSLSPIEMANRLVGDIKKQLPDVFSKIEVAPPGFINFQLADKILYEQLKNRPNTSLQGKIVVVEFSDPNPFKILHAGHLYTSIIGDAIANLLEQAGARVHRVNYGGDVGLHVGKSLWAMLDNLGGELPDKLETINPADREQWMSQAYVLGNKAYEENKLAKEQIIALNKRVYQIHQTNDHKSPLAKIYWTTRQWSYDSFDSFYKQLNITFERYYPESQAFPIGLELVREQLKKGVFQLSDGAVVFHGEKFGLHTRVFITAQGLPTYEAKELGVAELKRADYNYDLSIILTGNEQQQYMDVVLKAEEQFAPKLALSTTHLTHGMVKLSGGLKMSSRLGNIISAAEVLEATKQATLALSGKTDKRVVLAAVKYAMLKQRLGGDIIYEPEESVSILGNSGPYLQYAQARARSILAKAHSVSAVTRLEFNQDERDLVLRLSRYPAVVNQACLELSPHLVCTYLYELAQTFNHFYEANRVIGDEREALRLELVKVYADRLKNGLQLLGIESPEKL